MLSPVSSGGSGWSLAARMKSCSSLLDQSYYSCPCVGLCLAVTIGNEVELCNVFGSTGQGTPQP